MGIKTGDIAGGHQGTVRATGMTVYRASKATTTVPLAALFVHVAGVKRDGVLLVDGLTSAALPLCYNWVSLFRDCCQNPTSIAMDQLSGMVVPAKFRALAGHVAGNKVGSGVYQKYLKSDAWCSSFLPVDAATVTQGL